MRSITLNHRLIRTIVTAFAAGALVLSGVAFMPSQQSSAVAAPTSPAQTDEQKSYEKAAASAKKQAAKVAQTRAPFDASQGPRDYQIRTGSYTPSSSVTNNVANEMQPTNYGVVGAAKISGRLLTTAGAPVVGATVIATSETGEYWATTTSTGNYMITGLVAGTYSVRFDSVTQVTVKNLTASENRLKVDAKIALKAQIRGTVTGDAGAAADTLVLAFSASDQDNVVAWGYADASGSYFLHGLAAGQYKIYYDTMFVTSASYLPEWSSNKTTFAAADVITLAATTARTGLNESLAIGGTIRGFAHNDDGARLAGVPIVINRADGSYEILARAITNAQGEYVLRGIPSGMYKLIALAGESSSPLGYRNTWWPNAGSVDAGSSIQVNAGNTVEPVEVTVLTGRSISGRVTAPNGAGVQGVLVTAYSSTNEDEISADAVTDATGNYTLRGLAPDSYKLRYDTSGLTSASYLEQWSGARNTFADAVVIDATLGNQTAVNATLVKAASISGVIKNTAGAPIANANISVRSATSEWFFYGWASTDSKGVFTVRGIPAGSYKLRVDPYDVTSGSYFGTWFGGKSTFDQATSITLAATTAKTGANVTLAKAAQISGKVTGLASAPVRGVTVEAYLPSGDSAGGYAETDAQGNYTLRGLPAGTFKLYFNASNSLSGSYLSQWYNQRASLELATAVVVASAASKTGVNVVLSAGSSLTGRVIDDQGAAIRGVSVQALDRETGLIASSTTTDFSGNYTLNTLSDARAYSLWFDSSYVQTGSFFSSLFGVGGAPDMLSSAPFTPPTASTRVAGVVPDQVLASAASIRGRVVNAQGAPLRNARVEAHSSTNAFEGTLAEAQTDSRGIFTIRGLDAGSFKIFVDASGVQSATYLSEWAGSAPGTQFENATVFTIVGHTLLEPADIVATKAARITGNVVSATGTPLAGVFVEAYSSADVNSSISFTETDSSGKFILDALPAGSYKVRIDPRQNRTGSYRETWTDLRDSFASATVYTLATGASTELVDVEVFSGASISGKIIGAVDKKPIAGVTVTAFSATGLHNWVADGYTDASGNYVIRGLPAGSYQVRFDGNDETPLSYLVGWFGGTGTSEGATVLKLSSQQAKANINYSLVKAATVTGRVVDTDGDPIENVYVTAYRTSAQGTYIGMTAVTDEQGNYVLKGVPTTGAKIWFNGSHIENARFEDVYFGNSTTWENATALTIAAGATRTNVNVTLPTVTWTSIQGTVGTSGSGANSAIEVYNMDSVQVASVTADSAGHYSVSNLPAGTYKIKAIPAAMCYTANWYTDNNSFANDFGSSSPVIVNFRDATTLSRFDVALILTDVCA